MVIFPSACNSDVVGMAHLSGDRLHGCSGLLSAMEGHCKYFSAELAYVPGSSKMIEQLPLHNEVFAQVPFR